MSARSEWSGCLYQARHHRQPRDDFAVRIAFSKSFQRHPANGFLIQPSLRRLATPFSSAPRQLTPSQLMDLPFETGLPDKLGNVVVVVAETQLEAADVFNGARVQIVFEGPFLGQVGAGRRGSLAAG